MSVFPIEQIHDAIARLVQHKDAWIAVGNRDRIFYLEQCMTGVLEVAPEWVQAACAAKGIDPTSELAGEEWLLGPVTTLLNLRALIHSLKADGQPIASFDSPNVATVFPDNGMDRLLWLGFRGEVWLESGKAVTQAESRSPIGRVALVLGAGNVASIGPLDALYKLLAENQVVLLKLNPVNDYLRSMFEQAFRSLIEAGFLAIVSGDGSVGQFCCQHHAIDTIHITGSHLTHDAIVWDAEKHQLLLNKPITSELGCVTPVLVVPGQWSDAELKFQARHIASMVTNNASFNCAAAKVLVLAKGWMQRDRFLELVHQELASVAPRKAYYPGAQERYQRFLEKYPNAIPLGNSEAPALSQTVGDSVPWTILPDVEAIETEYALQTEAFCGVLAEVSVEATTAEEFLAIAVPFANEKIWGNLSCVMLIDPRTQNRSASAMKDAIAQLRYGAIGVNVWSGVIFALPNLTWGAYPGNELKDIRSGQGVVHNAYFFDRVEKSVLYAPFRIFPTPFWFANHANLRRLAQRCAEWQVNPTWINFARMALEAVKG